MSERHSAAWAEPFDLFRELERAARSASLPEPIGFGEREIEPLDLESEGDRLMRLVRECATS